MKTTVIRKAVPKQARVAWVEMVVSRANANRGGTREQCAIGDPFPRVCKGGSRTKGFDAA